MDCHGCEDTGYFGKRYCSCEMGKIQRAAAHKKRLKKKAESEFDVQVEKRKKIGFGEGDWVKVGIDLFVVGAINDSETKVLLKHGSGMRWVGIHKVNPAEIDITHEEIKAMIDLALELQDREWFHELASMLP